MNVLGMTHYYITLPEHELAKVYADYFFQPNARLTDMPYAYLVEVKYMKRGEPDSHIATLMADARAQLLRYSGDEMITSNIGRAKLRLLTVVFRGWELVDMEEVV